nr:immunoglobulin light chain junction region [Macaca mulatta]MOV34056.1 immunoglobulin light chain junction region [Macaca mulatta]MOV34122.1 immunoglobulin light chain junction region [Macaca mulatta]MOV34210.1 immunoglobulin light chain junction region [Macaca mulatta]MOV34252.1 immunoglobulin light chain junction region [Macaca mulatta]
CMQGLEFPFTF